MTLKLSLVCLASFPWLPLAVGAAEFRSHAPLRPLPEAGERRGIVEPARFVDPARGDDQHSGDRDRPWKTLAHSLRRLKPGDTLYLRGGTYYERVALTRSGTAERPITICGYPGELAILDGGRRE